MNPKHGLVKGKNGYTPLQLSIADANASKGLTQFAFCGLSCMAKIIKDTVSRFGIRLKPLSGLGSQGGLL